ncbi:DUF4261 domain-containing protein [Rhizosphaericola mali]|uniref:DUF4261 domain-containing protein n=1 Tax=Rhizosphaericola mali TaxID=2545455 RepID=A0A5P2G714_9BACT|nr:DUF4261 domain-containing protein [Rhizosphaericola mali]QES90059.1 DUF4261 domain-containing protein [Rhizosphaericola mali]
MDLLKNYELGNLYPMYVLDSISDGHGAVYTCGMHNLGLKDAMIVGEEFQAAVEVLSIFGYYQLIDQPTIKAGQTFSIAQDAPIFLISEEKHQPSHGDELFENPFGMWLLESIK